MKTLIKLISTSLLALISVSALADDTSDPNGEVVKQAITKYMEKNNISGVAVELYVNGKPLSYNFGYANREKQTPVTDKTIFELGSISKIMTSMLLTEEIDWSNMQLADPVKKYLPNLSNAFNKISLQNLATHTAGLPYSAPSHIKTNADLEAYLAGLTPTYPANQKWVYSNLGIGLLGDAVVQSTHRTLDQLYQRQIYKPLGMQVIGTTVPKKLKQYYAQGYSEAGNPVEVTSAGLLPGADAVKASAGDMRRFLSAAIGLPSTPEKIFYPMRMTQATYVKLYNQGQGLAWQIHPLTNISHLMNESEMEAGPLKVYEVVTPPTYSGDTLIDKTGATDGFRAYIAVLPNRKSGIVILTNRSATDNNIVSVGREILFKLTKLS